MKGVLMNRINQGEKDGEGEGIKEGKEEKY